MTLAAPPSAYTLSRFVCRWLEAKSTRLTELENIAQLSPSKAVFSDILQNEMRQGQNLRAAMRRTRHLVLANLIQRDLHHQGGLDEVMQTISDFADFVITRHLEDIMQDMVSKHGQPIGEESGEPQALMVIGMGKLGGYELNVSSDIDLIFCYAEDGETLAKFDQRSLSNHEFFIRLGKRLIADISEITEDGFSFRVDMALRPNGNSGPLACSLAMLEEYFLVQGREWERYAWVKARAITGISTHITALEKIVHPFVYRRYLDYGVIDSLRSMHQQIRAEVQRQESRHPDRGANVKLGRGGIREIEFLAQVFQLIRGGRESILRDRSTRKTLDTLADKVILDKNIVEQLQQSYAFLRNLEHRLQYLDDAQTHTLPANLEDANQVARMMDMADATELNLALLPHMRFVAEQFDAIFKDKSEPDSAVLSAPTLADPEALDAIRQHLQQLGVAEVDAMTRRLAASWQSSKIQSLSDASQQKLISVLNKALKLIASQQEAQAETLHRFINFVEQITRRTAYLSLLNEFPHALERVVRMMQASDWAAQFLNQHPILLDELLDETLLDQAPDWAQFSAELGSSLQAHEGDVETQLNLLREMHHVQQFRLLAQDLEGKLTVERLADELSKLADIIVEAVLQFAWKTIASRHRETPQFAVIAYGKLGGKELSYASDLDVIFLYDDDDQDAPAAYAKLAQRFITWMTTPTSSGILFDIDIALRPDGASGLMVSSLQSFQRYQEKSAWLWEHQALTRARFCAGDARIGQAFERVREDVLRRHRNEQELREEVTKMRQKMRDANPNRSDLFDLKHDLGGMIDIEFIVQYLLLRHANAFPELCGNWGNIALLKMCGELKLIDAELAKKTADCYRLLRKFQHMIRLHGEERARIRYDKVGQATQASTQLWQSIFET